MNFKTSIAVLGLALATLATTSASAATVTVGQNNGGNCYPFSCMAGDDTLHYQQIYAASSFYGATSSGTKSLDIDKISFLRDIGGNMTPSTYSVSFWLTSNTVNGMSSSASANEGTLLSNFGTWTLGGAMPGTLTLDGTDFIYNPTQGNLVMDVQVTSGNAPGGYFSFFEADYTGASTLRAFGNGDNLSVETGALVTQFTATPVPETGSMALMLAGLGLVGVVARRRRAA
jgi:hypothetical protein